MAALTILVIDDDPCILDTLRAALGEVGYHVITAAEGEEGLRLAETEKPAFVLTDMLMPKLSGFRVLEQLRQRAPELPVALMTGYAHAHQQSYAMALGAVAFFAKPLSLAELAACIHHHAGPGELSTDARSSGVA